MPAVSRSRVFNREIPPAWAAVLQPSAPFRPWRPGPIPGTEIRAAAPGTLPPELQTVFDRDDCLACSTTEFRCRGWIGIMASFQFANGRTRWVLHCGPPYPPVNVEYDTAESAREMPIGMRKLWKLFSDTFRPDGSFAGDLSPTNKHEVTHGG